jgi:hypothetical protein
MAVCEVGGVLMMLMGCMGLVFGKVLGGVWWSFLNLLHSRWGDGSKIRFGHDVWCGDQTLKVAFPKLFSITHF